MNLLIFLAFAAIGVCSQEIGTIDPARGVYIGELSNLAEGDIKGSVYVVNETALQIFNFTYNGDGRDVYFWIDETESPTVDGIKIPSFEFGITPLGIYENFDRVVLVLPGLHKLNTYKSFSLFSHAFETNFGSVIFPDNLNYPKPQILPAKLKGTRYNVGSGPIMIMDKRTIKVFGFTFDADKAPDGYFFVGRGTTIGNLAGVQVPIRGKDKPNEVTAMNKKYRGGEDVILDLPEDYDIEHIDWLSVYCLKFRVDFGHITISNVSSKIPPYVPLPVKFESLASDVEGWEVVSLLGTENRRNFTFQLGAPGGRKGYEFMARSRPSKYVWYVNGLLANIVLERGITYTFIVEGGNDKTTTDFYNPLYLSTDKYGGFGKLTKEEREHVSVVYPEEPSKTAGRLCVWSNEDNVDADSFDSFYEFRSNLRLKCETDKVANNFKFTPGDDTPDVIYYQSFSSYNMGWQIRIVDKLPENTTDFKEQPYKYDQWLESQKLSGNPVSQSTSLTTFFIFALLTIALL